MQYSPGPQTGSIITPSGLAAERDANGTLTLNGMLWTISQGQAVNYNGVVYTDATSLNLAISKVGAAANWQMVDLSIGSAVRSLQEAIGFIDVQAAQVALSPNGAAATALATRRTLLASMVSQLQSYVASDA